MSLGKAEGQSAHQFHLSPDLKGEDCALRFLVLTCERSILQDADAFAELAGVPPKPAKGAAGRAAGGGGWVQYRQRPPDGSAGPGPGAGSLFPENSLEEEQMGPN